MTYHSFYLNLIKKEVKASYVAYEQYKDSYQLKVIVDKVPTYYALTGKPNDVTPQKYQDLLKLIINEQQI